MLSEIHIRDLVTIEDLHLTLPAGTTVITGETGAGKSIFIEAIELALGNRGNPQLIRPGKERADISLAFNIAHLPMIASWLKDRDLHQGAEECIIRRVISNDGRSRSYINGTLTTLQTIRELSDLLLHVHGQYEQQVLLKADKQRELLDRYAAHPEIVAEVASLADTRKKLCQEIESLQKSNSEQTQRSEFLRFQLQELQTLQLQTDEWAALEKEQRKLSHAESLIQHIQQAIALLTHEDKQNILGGLRQAYRSLEAVQTADSKIIEWLQTLDNATLQLNDLEQDLHHYLQRTELDPERLQAVELRMGQIHALARKHKIQPEALLAYQQTLTDELAQIDSSDTRLLALEQQKVAIEKQYTDAAKKLSASRKKAAKKLSREITVIIRSLSLPHGEFSIALEEEPVISFSPHGLERILFLMKTNPDQSLQPLAKVISGGELSRLSLAAHLVLAREHTVPVLIFDEIDTGVGGGTAEKIGKLLHQLGQSCQAFCITHQHQVAAKGHHHLLVEKYFTDNVTHTRLRLLNTEEKTKEIARMLGGEKITKKTLDHAREILSA